MYNQSLKTETGQSNQSSHEYSSFLRLFKTQLVRPWTPIPTLPKTIALFFILSIIFVALGIPMIILSNQIQQVRFRYDTCQINSICVVNFDLQQTMQGPLNGFYQNHRAYANSISDKQLKGEILNLSDVSAICQPIVTNQQLYIKLAIDGTPLEPSQPANPCGIIAYSIYNDTFDILYPNGTNITTITTEGIAWPSDETSYKVSNKSAQWLNVSNPRVMNWMRIATISDFRKLWGRINHPMEAGNYTVVINNVYNVSQFGTQKYIVLSTSNFFGSKNRFISIMYLCMGVSCFLIAIFFFFRYQQERKKKKR